MNYKILQNEDINKAFKRIGIELLDDSILHLQNVGLAFDDSIHETRKNFKKMRGLLRLIKFDLGNDLYKKENVLFRDTGRILSGIRDVAVMVETFDYINKKYPDAIERSEFRQVRKNLSLRARRVRAQFKKNKELIEAVINILKNHKSEINKWPLRENSFNQILPGIKLVYELGQIALTAVSKNQSAENFHEWRKRAKYLWYHTRLLEIVWPDYMNLLSSKLSELSDLLGLEHDLSELRNLLLIDKLLFVNKDAQLRLFHLVGQERLNLQSSAKSLAPFIYGEIPDNFTNRLNVYWAQSQKLTSD